MRWAWLFELLEFSHPLEKVIKSIRALKALSLGFILTASTPGAIIFYEGFGEGPHDSALAIESSDTKATGWFPVEVPGGFSFPEYQKRYYAPQPGDISYFFPPNVELPYAPGTTQRLNEYGNSIHQHGLRGRNIDMSKDGVYFISFLLRSFLPDSDGEATVSLVGPTSAIHLGYRFSDHFAIATSAWNEMAYQGKAVDSPDKFPGNETYFVVAMVETRARGKIKFCSKPTGRPPKRSPLTRLSYQTDGFPTRYRVLAGESDSDPGRVIHVSNNIARPLDNIAPDVIAFTAGVNARWIKIEALSLSQRVHLRSHILQLSEVLVFSGEENVALRQTATAATDEPSGHPGWSVAFLTDGLVPYLMNSSRGAGSFPYLSSIGIGDKPQVTIDLGESMPVSEIRLHAVDQGDTAPQGYPGDFLLPRQFGVQLANRDDFTDATTALQFDYTSPYSVGPILAFPLETQRARYVRLIATRPYIDERAAEVASPTEKGSHMGFAEIEVISGGRNFALHRPVTSNFQLAFDQNLADLTDGQNLFGEILGPREWMEQLARRQTLEREKPLIDNLLLEAYAEQALTARRLKIGASVLAASLVITLITGHLLRRRYFERLHTSIAANLHDDLGANLHAIGLLSDVARQRLDRPDSVLELLDRIRSLTQSTGQAVRKVAQFKNQGTPLENLTLEMRRIADNLTAAGVAHDFVVDSDAGLSKLHPREQVGLLLFYKECLVNITRHSGATRFNTRLTSTGAKTTLVVCDNGGGIPVEPGHSAPGSLLRRAKLLRAHITVERAPAGGTLVTLVIDRKGFKKFLPF